MALQRKQVNLRGGGTRPAPPAAPPALLVFVSRLLPQPVFDPAARNVAAGEIAVESQIAPDIRAESARQEASRLGHQSLRGMETSPRRKREANAPPRRPSASSPAWQQACNIPVRRGPQSWQNRWRAAAPADHLLQAGLSIPRPCRSNAACRSSASGRGGIE
jgi:hypothetical protein